MMYPSVPPPSLRISPFRGVLPVALREWRNLLALDKGVLAVFCIVIAAYGFIIGLNLSGIEAQMSYTGLWWLLFSVVVSSMFSNAAFVTERVTGAIEILLTSGIAREAVLTGKIVFAVSLGALAGALAAVVSICGVRVVADNVRSGYAAETAWGFLLFLAALWLNACCVAWLSVRLPNPRLSQFANFMLVALLGGGLLGAGFCQLTVAIILALTGAVFFLLARRAFHSEKVVSQAGI